MGEYENSRNPCFTGIWSGRLSLGLGVKDTTVLILVLLEYGRRAPIDLIRKALRQDVLILVLLEYGLREHH